MTHTKTIFLTAITTASATALLLGASGLLMAWTAPAQTPPDGNVSAPVNVGTVDQIKDGGLGVDTLAVYGAGTLYSTLPRLTFFDTDQALSSSNPTWGVRANEAGYFKIQSTADNSAYTDRVVINSSGNVGVGVSAPVTTMQVHASGNTQTRLALTNGDTGSTVADGFQIGLNDALDGTVRDAVLRNKESTRMYFYTSDLVRMTILSDGNIGIGTTEPTAKLHIGGTAGVDGIKFPDGTLQTTAATAAASGVTEQTTVSCSHSGAGGVCSVSCPSGYIRSACSDYTGSSGGSARPSGSTSCQCSGTGVGTCYAYCIR